MEIDGVKLRHEFEVRNISLKDASNKCGFEDSYFSNVCSAGKITKPASNLLHMMFNIRYEEYALNEVTEEPRAEELSTLTITEETSKVLYDIIYSAVYDAVKKAWSE